jgi:predicted transposase/invertase (TIGR01784 family)
MALWHPHDRLFAAATSSPERALQLLRLALPEESFRKLDASSLKIESGSFLEEDLREQHSDLLLSARYANMPVLIYTLLEHKSEVEPMVLVQMLGYLVNVWKAQHASRPDEPLSPILPILISHAAGGWTGPVALSELFGGGLKAHPELVPYVPDYRVVLEDLQQRDDAALRQAALDPGLLLALATLRDARHADMIATLRNFMEELKAVATRRDARLLLQQLVTYLVEVPPSLPWSELRAILKEASADPEELMATIAEQLRGEGRIEGKRETVLELLKFKFGDLTAEQEATIRNATPAELDRFKERVVSADTLVAVFALDA